MSKPKRKHYYKLVDFVADTVTWKVARTPKDIKSFKSLGYEGVNFTKAEAKQFEKALHQDKNNENSHVTYP